VKNATSIALEQSRDADREIVPVVSGCVLMQAVSRFRGESICSPIALARHIPKFSASGTRLVWRWFNGRLVPAKSVLICASLTHAYVTIVFGSAAGRVAPIGP
jgi:hypothetical protein